MAQNTSMLHSLSLLILISGILITLASKNVFKGSLGLNINSLKDYITGEDISKTAKKADTVEEEKEASTANSRREIESFDYNLFE